MAYLLLEHRFPDSLGLANSQANCTIQQHRRNECYQPRGTTLQFDKVMRQVASIVSSEDVTVNTKIVDRQGAAGNDYDATKAMRRIIDHILYSYSNMAAMFKAHIHTTHACVKIMNQII